ncbi:AraC family transcriptional regulator [Vibrio astriarenae]|uniref:AraC family transcriptional regulator n=1 Tax=Vibrio astriarenae TaxID=1481923 RepID=UPI00373658B4
MNKVLVLLDVMVFYDREVFQGIKSSINSRDEEASIYISSESNLPQLKQEHWDIVIADGDKLSDLEAVSRLAAKCLIYSSYQLSNVPANVTTLALKNEQFSDLALGKFIELDINKVAFFENEFDSTFEWNRERKDAFVSKARNLGFELVDINRASALVGGKKVGVLCSTDRSARTLIQRLADENIMVPQQVSIIGIDCDPIENEISPISITSIDISPFEIGKLAANVISSYRPANNQFYVPWRLEENDSCTSTEESDCLVSRALFFIYNNYQNSIKVTDVARYCRVSRKTLDNRFFAAKNITVHQYIADQRLDKCKRLLKETEQSVEDIALQCGYPHQSYLYQVFRKNVDCTPLEYRKEHLLAQGTV